MMYKLGWMNWARLIVWLIIGLVMYFCYSRNHSKVQLGLDKASQFTADQPEA